MITKIPLADQVLAILRVWRLNSIEFRPAIDIATALGRSRGEILPSLSTLYDIGVVQRYSPTSITLYRVNEQGERTKGCCCCCNGKLFDASRLFCETCGPEFDGRV